MGRKTEGSGWGGRRNFYGLKRGGKTEEKKGTSNLHTKEQAKRVSNEHKRGGHVENYYI